MSSLLFKNFALFGSENHDYDKQKQQQQQSAFCVLVQNNIISAIGTEQECMTVYGDEDVENLEIIDGNEYKKASGQEEEGKQQHPPLLSPGFIDSHVHFLDGGGRLSYILDMSTITNKEDFGKSLVEHKFKIFGQDADTHPNRGSEWLFGSGWDDEYLGGLPDRSWIDAVEDVRPVFLYRCDMHTALVNTAALKICGIDRDTPQPEGGVIEHDENGEPNGLLRDRAVWEFARQKFPKTSHVRLAEAFEAATHRFHSTGITCVHDMSTMDVHTNIEEFQFFQDQFQQGKVKIRMRTSLRAHEFDDAVTAGLIMPSILSNKSTSEDQQEQEQSEDQEQAAEENNKSTSDFPPPNSSEENQMIRLAFLKMFTDGSLGSRTARMHQPYAPRKGECHDELYKQAHKGCQCGVYVRTYDDLAAGVTRARQHGLLPCLHAIGDAAVSTAIDAFKSCEIPKLQIEEPYNCPFAGRIEHCQHILAKDFHRLQELNVVASIQPMHMASDAIVAERVLGQWRRPGAFPLASLVRQHKVHMAFGSDWPVVTQCPAKAIFAAATRRSHWEEMPKMNVVPEEVPSASSAWDRRQCLTMRECLHNYTAAPAEACPGDSNFLGKLRVGYAADFVILSPKVTNLLVMNPEVVSNVPGRVIYNDPNGSPAEVLNDEINVYLETYVNGERVFSRVRD